MNIVRHYGMPDSTTCSECAGQCEAGKRCPRSVPTTEPGELAPEREDRPVAGTGFVLSLLIVFCGICMGSALALAVNGWPK